MELRLRDILEDTDTAVISLWHVKENERVEKEQDLMEIVTDKATFEVPAPYSGVLSRIVKEAGEEIAADEVIAVIEEAR